MKISKLIVFFGVILLLFVVATGQATAERVGKCFPHKDDFPGELLETSTQRWSLKRSSGTGGANKGHNMLVPEGRVVVDWDTQRTSCNSRCTRPGESVHFRDMGAFKLPDGVHVGVRWKKDLNPTGPGGIYSGTATMLHVPIDAWKKVFLDKYFTCVP